MQPNVPWGAKPPWVRTTALDQGLQVAALLWPTDMFYLAFQCFQKSDLFLQHLKNQEIPFTSLDFQLLLKN